MIGRPVKRRSKISMGAQAVLCILAMMAVTLFAVYLGVWLLFVGGIVEIVEGVKATPVSGVDIGLGLLRFTVSWPVGIGAFVAGNAIVAQLWPRQRYR